jgi:hypothetical protein
MLQVGRSPVQVDFSIYLTLPVVLWPCDQLSLWQKWVPGTFLGVKSGRSVGLTTLPPSVSRVSENVGASTSRNPKGLHGLYRDNFTSYNIHIYIHILFYLTTGRQKLYRGLLGISGPQFRITALKYDLWDCEILCKLCLSIHLCVYCHSSTSLYIIKNVL